jgi:hypothetical protein
MMQIEVEASSTTSEARFPNQQTEELLPSEEKQNEKLCYKKLC